MTRLREVFGRDKVIIGMVHLPPLPGAPLYDDKAGMIRIIESVSLDLHNLQAGGIDAIMFCNENDRPYTLQAGPETVAAMTRTITHVLGEVRVPYGVDILWDPVAALAVAKATGASFIREVITGVYGGEIGIWNTDSAKVWRYRKSIGADHIRMLYNINAEFAAPLAPRPIADVARSAVFSSLADGLCVSGIMTGSEVASDVLKTVRDAVPETPIFANTGVTSDNVLEKLKYADGVVVGTSLKVDGVTWNPVDPKRVAAFMQIVRSQYNA